MVVSSAHICNLSAVTNASIGITLAVLALRRTLLNLKCHCGIARTVNRRFNNSLHFKTGYQ